MTLNRYNYEEFFMLYIDGELEVEDRTSVEAFVRANPDLGEELRQLQKAVLVPDETFSLDKRLLYMEEPAPRAAVYPIRMRALLAAASVILLAGAAFWLMRANRTSYVRGDHPQVAASPHIATPTAPQVAPAHTAVPVTGSATIATHIRAPRHLGDADPVRIVDTPRAIAATDLRPAVQPADAVPRPILTVSGPIPSYTLAVANNENNHPTVTTPSAVSYHTLEDTDQKNADDKILFVRADQVMTGGVKGLFRKAGRVIKHSTSLSAENVHPDPDAE